MGTQSARESSCRRHDYENMLSQKMTEEGEHIAYSGRAMKKNKKGLKNSKILVITNKYFYNMKNRNLVSRKLELKKIIGITVSIAPQCAKVIVHVDR